MEFITSSKTRFVSYNQNERLLSCPPDTFLKNIKINELFGIFFPTPFADHKLHSRTIHSSVPFQIGFQSNG
jgi:hypothetical protein